MYAFIKENITITELVLILSGVLFFVSTLFIARGGDLSISYVAKGCYFFGTLLLVVTSQKK